MSASLKKACAVFLNHFESWLCMFLLAFFVIMIFLQIILRHLYISLPWTEELARFSFLWFVLFGACYATRRNAFNRVTAQLRLLPEKGAVFCLFLADLIWLGFSLTLAWQGALAVLRLVEYPWISPALEWPLAVVYVAFPASFLLMAIRIIQVNLEKFFSGKTQAGKPGPERPESLFPREGRK